MDKLDNKKIAIIGGGHMGLALIEGLINSGKINVSQIIVSTPTLTKVVHLEKRGIFITTDNKIAAEKADIIFLAVKPLIIDRVMTEVADLIEGKLIISLAAVVSLDTLKRKTKNASVVRIMPNLAIRYNRGVIGLFGNKNAKSRIKQLLSTLGLVIEVEKDDSLDTLTLLSSCGIAIVAEFIKLLEDYGQISGLSTHKSQEVALQTFKGTLALLKDNYSTNSLIQSVSTKGGITEKIISELERNLFRNNFTKSMNSGSKKIEELRKKLIKSTY